MTDNDVPEKRASRFRQFGIRTLLVLVAVAGVVCGLAGREMAREVRRETLIAELEKSGASWLLYEHNPSAQPPRLWREPIGAWLRGKPMVTQRLGGMFRKGTSPQQIREFLDLFPAVEYVEIDSEAATTDVLRSLASHGPYDGVRFKNPLAIDQESARQLAQVSSVCKGGLLFENQNFSDADLKNLADAGVKAQYFVTDDYWRNISDEGLKAVAKSPVSAEFNLSCRGTDEAVRALAGKQSLSLLYLTGPSYTDASVNVFPTLPELRHLSFAWTSHTDAGLAKAISSCNPTNITLNNVAAGGETFAAIAKAARLRSLTLKGIDLSSEQCDALAKLSVPQLTIHSKSLSDDKIARLAPLASSLESLELRAPLVTDAGLAWLKDANSLSGLRLDDTQTTVATWSALPSPSRSLQVIGMGGPNLNAETLKWASEMELVYSFVLTGGDVNDATLELLPQSVQFVTLVGTQVTPDGLKKLAWRKGTKSITVLREGDAPPLIKAADVKETQATIGPLVEIHFKDASWYRCE